MGFRRKTGLAAASLLLFCANGWADTISLPLTDDALINGNNPNLNVGTNENLFVHSWGPKQGLIRFDAASIAGLSVSNAVLELYLNNIASPGTVSIYAITSSWNESSVTWNTQPPAEVTATAVVDLGTADEGSVISIDVTDAVARWADGSLPDAGFLIVTTDSIKAYFDAKERPGGLPASLEVDSGPPAYTGETLQPTQDTFSNGIKPNKNYANYTAVVVRSWGPNQGFVQFDLSDLGNSVDAATLTMDIIDVKAAGSISLYQVLEPWDEDTLTFNWEPTYMLAPFASVPIGNGNVGSTVAVDVTSIVQAWATGADNYGIAFVATGGTNVKLGSIDGGNPMMIDAMSSPVECPVGTLLEPYIAVCAPVNDITDQFAPAAASAGVQKVSPDGIGLEGVSKDVVEPPVPGGYGAGTRYAPNTHQALEHAVFHTKMFVQPDGVGSETSDWWLMTPATNHTDSATEFVGLYASHLEEGWWGIFGRPCTPEYPCPDGDTGNGWQAGWTHTFDDYPCYVRDFVDKGAHSQKVMHYANETIKLDETTPPLWRNAIYLWNNCNGEWDLIWSHEYRENKRDCSVEGCYKWGPILETVGTQGQINELGYEDSLLFHDGNWSSLAADETQFVTPISPWILSHHEPNGGYGVGNRFITAGPQFLGLTDDAFVNGKFPCRRYGLADTIAVASWAPKIGFARFDVEPLGTSYFSSASLNTEVSWLRRAGYIDIHVVYQEWDEASVTYDKMPAYDPTPVATLEIDAADAGETIAVDLTDLVRQWQDGSIINNGIAFVPSDSINVRLTSKEAGDGKEITIKLEP